MNQAKGVKGLKSLNNLYWFKWMFYCKRLQPNTFKSDSFQIKLYA